MQLTKRFEDALAFALSVHRGQYRKGTRIPYASHLLAVSAIVLDYGGDEDEAIAALLHDSIEDGGVDPAGLSARFGSRVAEIVLACSDSLVKDPLRKAPWHERKENYLEHMKTAPASVLLVSIADKLHNIRTIVKDLHEIGDEVWNRFHAGKDDSLWYYDSLEEIFRARGFHSLLVDEFAHAMDEVWRLEEEI